MNSNVYRCVRSSHVHEVTQPYSSNGEKDSIVTRSNYCLIINQSGAFNALFLGMHNAFILTKGSYAGGHYTFLREFFNLEGRTCSLKNRRFF